MLDQVAHPSSEHDRLQLMFEHAPGFMALVEGPDHKIAIVNDAFEALVGRRSLVGKPLAEALPEFDVQGIDDIMDGVARSGQAFVGRAMPLSIERPDQSTEQALVNVVFQPIPLAGGQGGGIFIQGQNVTEDKRSETLRNAHSRVLELAIGDAPLKTTLTELIRIVESTSTTGVLGSILLLDADGKHLRSGAAPSLPPEYSAALDGAEIGPCAGSCGTAAYLGAAVFVSDIASDPLWADYRNLALPHGLRACWSTPILTRGRKVLGTFAMYHGEPREPTVRDLMLVDLVTQTAALVIDREQAKLALQNIFAEGFRGEQEDEELNRG
ncbi:MAG: GAF domain-containing protein [Sphingomonas sp.]